MIVNDIDDPYYGGPWPAGGGISPGGPLPSLGTLPGGTLLGNRPRCEPGRENDGFRQVSLVLNDFNPLPRSKK